MLPNQLIIIICILLFIFVNYDLLLFIHCIIKY